MAELNLETIRELVKKQFAQLGCNAEPLHEFILLDDWNFCGYRFKNGQCMADWRIAMNQIEFTSDSQSQLTISLPNQIDESPGPTSQLEIGPTKDCLSTTGLLNVDRAA